MSRFIDADEVKEALQVTKVLDGNTKEISYTTNTINCHPTLTSNLYSIEWFQRYLDLFPSVDVEPKKCTMTNFDWLVENDRLLQFLKDIVLTECADGVKFERVFTKKWGIEIEWGETVWNIFAKWLVSPHEEKNIFDVEEIHENCTVQILRNSATGEESIGWWKNE